MKLTYDGTRDNASPDVAQDILVMNHNDSLIISQWEGTGDVMHCIYVPASMAHNLITALASLFVPGKDGEILVRLPGTGEKA